MNIFNRINSSAQMELFSKGSRKTSKVKINLKTLNITPLNSRYKNIKKFVDLLLKENSRIRIFKGPVLASMLCTPLLLFWFLRERGVHCY